MRPITVQQSFPRPRPTSNPYIAELADALRATDDVEVRTFRWRDALLRRADVFHAHWPEILVGGNGRVKATVRQGLFVLLLLRLRLSRTPIVRTVHNLELPAGLSRVQVILLRWFERWTAVRIALNTQTPEIADVPQVVIPHGHYRDWFSRWPVPAPVEGRYTYFGLIRRYKNVEALAAAFTELTGDVSLEIAGKPSGDELVATIEQYRREDARITARYEFLNDPDLVELVGRSELVVLPYRHMHNSGGVLLALSLDRPVLVPSTEANRELAAEVGPGWVFMFDGELRADDLASALEQRRALAHAPRPDLSQRDWDRSARLHLAAYRLALGR